MASNEDLLMRFGCWLCNSRNTNSYPIIFSIEWDAPVHLDCLLKEYHYGNIYAKMIVREFGGIDEIIKVM